MSEDIVKFLNMVLSGLGVIALIFVIVKIFRLDRFVPPIIPGVLGGEQETQQTVQPQPVQVQTTTPTPSMTTDQAYGSYYYTDLYDNLPNVPQIHEPSVSHNKAGNKTQIEDLPVVTSEYNQAPVVDKETEVEPFFDETMTEIRPIPKPVPMIIQPRRKTQNREQWSIDRNENGDLIGISVERDVKEFDESE